MERVNVDSISLKPTAIIKNQIVPGKAKVGNFVCLLAKRYIYVQRCMKKQVLMTLFRHFVKKTQNIEKYIAVKNGKMKHYSIKWECTENEKYRSYYRQ